MFLVTGPVTSNPSACLGDATNRAPKRSASYTGPNADAISSSQPLHDPASTWRSWSDPMSSSGPAVASASGASASVTRRTRQSDRHKF